MHAELQEDQRDACDNDQRREQRQDRTQKWIGPFEIDLQFAFEPDLLRRLEQTGSGPLAHQGLSAKPFFVFTQIAPHAARPNRRASATSARMTIVPEMTKYASNAVNEETWRSTGMLMPR